MKHGPGLIGALTVLALGQAMNLPALQSLISRRAAREEQGSTLGVTQGFSSLARAVGPFCAGWLFDLGMASPYLTAALIMAVAFVLSLQVLGRQAVAAAA